MMRIACLGWGSLVWDPRTLPVTDWYEDGPLLPVEFTRVSGNGRVTLVLDHEATPVQALWTELKVGTLDEAVEALKVREDVPSAKSIGRWPGSDEYPFTADIAQWASRRSVDCVVWTALKVGFKDSRGTRPTLEQLVAHTATLSPEAKAVALEYLEKAPVQIQTAYRPTLTRVLRCDAA